jgi:processive 1,2-diacylglycerol beta-glucosyltransferase
VVTDFDVQGMWLTRHVERYFVALDETRAHLERLGVPPVAITVSGIPIDPVFAIPKDQRAVPWAPSSPARLADGPPP